MNGHRGPAEKTRASEKLRREEGGKIGGKEGNGEETRLGVSATPGIKTTGPGRPEKKKGKKKREP